MSNNFLFEKVKRFAKNNEINVGDIWRNLEHITYLSAKGEITLDAAERYARALFQLAEEEKES